MEYNTVLKKIQAPYVPIYKTTVTPTKKQNKQKIYVFILPFEVNNVRRGRRKNICWMKGVQFNPTCHQPLMPSVSVYWMPRCT